MRRNPVPRTRLLGPAVALLCIGALLPAVRADAPLRVGDLFPWAAAPGLVDPAGAGMEGRVVIVDFWASWCEPCRASFPFYSQLSRDLSGAGLVILGVSVDQDRGDCEAFVRRQAPAFPVVRDGAQRLVAAVQVPAMPTSYLLDRRGRVRYVHPGFHGGESERAIRAEVQILLSETNPRNP
jgi:thiol-disulfide isomerase/thioredoxin